MVSKPEAVKVITTKTVKTVASNGYVLTHVSHIILKNGKELKLPDKISFYIELQTKILVLTYYPTEDLPVDKEDIYRNIFCYDKETGREIWQVESQEESPYVGLHLGIKKEEGDYEWQEIVEKGSIEKIEYTSELFRKDKDKVAAVTFNSHQYYIDIETGKVEWFGYTK